MKPHRGVLILVFGILSLVLCPFLGIAAWVMANNDLQEMALGRMDLTGRDMTKAGRICGMIGTVLLGLQLVIVLVAVIGMAVFSESGR
jgi:hypothetical protein